MVNLAFTDLSTGSFRVFTGKITIENCRNLTKGMQVTTKQGFSLKALKRIKGFNSLKISLKTSLKTIKNNVFKDRRFFQSFFLKTKTC